MSDPGTLAAALHWLQFLLDRGALSDVSIELSPSREDPYDHQVNVRLHSDVFPPKPSKREAPQQAFGSGRTVTEAIISALRDAVDELTRPAREAKAKDTEIDRLRDMLRSCERRVLDLEDRLARKEGP